jgi:glycosyltransferase involved in cell wall biosynthesis
MLAARMQQGFGVSVVVKALAHEIARGGDHTVHVGCLQSDPTFGGLPVSIVDDDLDSVRGLAEESAADVIVAHTTPFFEMLPMLQERWPTIAWEHGDPTPALFAADREERERIADAKRRLVYPSISGVVAISEFVRSDIGWPAAVVIPNGCEHVDEAFRNGDPAPFERGDSGKLRVGTLCRFGRGENRYKGYDLLLELIARLSGDDRVQFVAAGRGDVADVQQLRSTGVQVHLNIDEAAKRAFYRSLDVFVSTSLWEGCNLPLLEAQACGAVGVALDTGAHPEVTLFPLRSLSEMEAFVASLAASPERARELRALSSSFVRENFSWDRSAARFLRYLERNLPRGPERGRHMPSPRPSPGSASGNGPARPEDLRCAAVIHLFYEDVFDELHEAVARVPIATDFFVSVRQDASESFVARVADALPRARVVRVPNQGFDVAPFALFLREVVDANYDVAIKVHAKRSSNIITGELWRRDMLRKLLGSEGQILAILERFLRRPDLGVVAPAGYVVSGVDVMGTEANARHLRALAERAGVPFTRDFRFAAGTMFWFRPRALARLADLRLSPDDFPVSRGERDGTLAHAVERFIGLAADADGYTVEPTPGGEMAVNLSVIHLGAREIPVERAREGAH